MNAKNREILDQIDNILQAGDNFEGGNDAQELWSVLTALRGPDSGLPRVKAEATIPIRRAAFPKTAAKQFIVADFGSHETPQLVRIPFPDNDYWHFNSHATEAANALDIPLSRSRNDID